MNSRGPHSSIQAVDRKQCGNCGGMHPPRKCSAYCLWTSSAFQKRCSHIIYQQQCEPNRSVPTQFFIVNHRVPSISGFPSCQELNLISRIDNVTQTSPRKTAEEFQDVFQGLGCYPKEHHIPKLKQKRYLVRAAHSLPDLHSEEMVRIRHQWIPGQGDGKHDAPRSYIVSQVESSGEIDKVPDQVRKALQTSSPFCRPLIFERERCSICT